MVSVVQCSSQFLRAVSRPVGGKDAKGAGDSDWDASPDTSGDDGGPAAGGDAHDGDLGDGDSGKAGQLATAQPQHHLLGERLVEVRGGRGGG